MPTSILVADTASPGRSVLPREGFPQQHVHLTRLRLISSFRTVLYNAFFWKVVSWKLSWIKLGIVYLSVGKKTPVFYLGSDVESHGQRADLNLNLFNFKMQVVYCKLKMDKYKAGSQALEDVIISMFFPIDNLFLLSVELGNWNKGWCCTAKIICGLKYRLCQCFPFPSFLSLVSFHIKFNSSNPM